MKKDLITFIVLIAVCSSATAERAAFIAQGYSYSRKTDHKMSVSNPVVGKEFPIEGVCTLTLQQGGGETEPSVEGGKMVFCHSNEIVLTNAPGVKISGVKIRFSSSPYGQHTDIRWSTDDGNADLQFSFNKGTGENGTNIRTQNNMDAQKRVVIRPKGELQLNFIEVDYTVDQTSAAGEVEEDMSNEPVEYFNLSGVRVPADALVPGIYIRRQGRVSKKILIK